MTSRLLLLVFLTFTVLICHISTHDHGHGHAHDHGHAHGHVHGHSHEHGHAHEEPPSFKYSREANEAHQDHGHSHGHSHSDHLDAVTYAPPHYNEGSDDDDDEHEDVPYSVMSWALLSTLGISIAPVIILLFIPVTNSPQHQWILKILLSFASGGLLGDAFLHLIPHAMSSHGGDGKGHGHTHSHSHAHAESHDHSADIHIGLNILLGIFLFLVVEKFVRHMKGSGHSHGHTHEAVKAHDSDADETDEKKKKSPKKAKPKTAVAVVPQSEIKISGYLNLFADFLHNFTDGLAIGSTYLLGRKVGAITTMTIFFHEIPHEIGDYAILIQNGCSRKKAMLLQLTTAIGALLGCLVGLLFHSIGTQAWATQTFLPITAGGFIYIATVSVIPELLATNGGLKQTLLEMIALITGVLIMVAVAIYE